MRQVYDINFKDQIFINKIINWLINNKTTLGSQPNFLKRIIEIIDSLESFSLYFTMDIAEEKMAFPCIGYSFCKIVECYLPFVYIALQDYKYDYHNLRLLFDSWSKKLEKAKIANLVLEKEQEKANILSEKEKEIDQLKDLRDKFKEEVKKTIGTNY